MFSKRKLLFAALSVSLLLHLPASAQVAGFRPQENAASVPPDELKRFTPRDTVFSFLQACQFGNYLRASQYLDLRRVPARDRRRKGMQLALQLEEVLNRDSSLNVEGLSSVPEGERHDGLRDDIELVDVFEVDGRKIPVQLQRVDLRPGVPVWLFSADTVDDIPSLQVLLGESEWEKHLPGPLVKITFMDTALWRWGLLILLIPALASIGRLLTRAVLVLMRRLLRYSPALSERIGMQDLAKPVTFLLGIGAYGAAITFISPSALVRFYLAHFLTLLAFFTAALVVIRIIELLSRRVQLSADVRQRAIYSSVVPLGLRVARIVVFTIALLSTFSTWGYNTGTIWATLGVGSLAVALAAQKTIENFFGGVSVIGDRPVLVGDLCRVGDLVGTVEDIGLRSTRIRTQNRTVVTVPNSQFSTMMLENFTKRDKMWFHPTFSLRCDAHPAQIRQVMHSFESILKGYPDIEPAPVPVRFSGIGDYSYDLEISAYVLTPDYDKFLRVRSELFLTMLDAVEAAGTALAVPVRELAGPARPRPLETAQNRDLIAGNRDH